MKTIIIITILLINSTLFSQETLVLEPEIGTTYDFSQKKLGLWVTCDSLFTDKFPTDRFTQKEKYSLINKCAEVGFSEACNDSWAINCGCSWYCGAQLTSVIASSSLKGQNAIVYDAPNVGDLNYKTVWVEGVKGDGIGEFVVYEFPPINPRITKIIIANGYIKDKKTWQNNSRVKQLKMYVDNKFYAILNLKDVYAEQTFKVLPIGNSQRKIISYTKGGKITDDMNGNIIPPIKIKFEILAVYKGDKYEDTAISEIYFDGIDVH